MRDLSALLRNEQNPEKIDQILHLAFQQIQNNKLKQEIIHDLAKDFGIRKRQLNQTKIKSLRPWWLTAAAVLFLAIGGYFIIQLNSNQVDFSQFAMETKIKHPGMTKGNSAATTSLIQAIKAYDAEKWDSAAIYFQNTDLTQPENLYFLGLSHFYNGKFTNSNEIFSNKLFTESVYKQEVTWFLGLGQLLSGNKTKAKEIFHSIKPTEWKYKEANKILSNL